jgi:tetratricopeptide (TPR) repeat protein
MRMARADILCAQGKLEAALMDCEQALRSSTGSELDWFLTRADLQRRLGRPAPAAAGLKEAFDRTGSAVLEAEWIEAMIEAGQFDPALERIQTHLAESRYQSSWLLRRARARLGQGRISEAHEDLRIAIAGLNQRLRGTFPEVSLLADRSFAYALLGDTFLAKQDLDAARKGGADEECLRRIEAILAGRA